MHEVQVESWSPMVLFNGFQLEPHALIKPGGHLACLDDDRFGIRVPLSLRKTMAKQCGSQSLAVKIGMDHTPYHVCRLLHRKVVYPSCANDLVICLQHKVVLSLMVEVLNKMLLLRRVKSLGSVEPQQIQHLSPILISVCSDRHASNIENPDRSCTEGGSPDLVVKLGLEPDRLIYMQRQSIPLHFQSIDPSQHMCPLQVNDHIVALHLSHGR